MLKIHENYGVVSDVCQRLAGLVNIKLSNSEYLVDGKKINAFTNEEEIGSFILESKLIERWAIFKKSRPWQNHVVADQRVVTRQNPASTKSVGEATLAELKKLK